MDVRLEAPVRLGRHVGDDAVDDLLVGDSRALALERFERQLPPTHGLHVSLHKLAVDHDRDPVPDRERLRGLDGHA